ncbi:PepSY domain-containing protein [Sphingobacterium sp. E70]|uniref:PepSY domain-containing protein n=1 Tax=Sphingobacterium sp. E70 TaxID=2853439 RepID=UPI00211C483B|nr:PepSY domain-containing protein [Sphingobacterium sp. E70]ULT27112.1 PepSY domain-containing protein [Sphingobacterium sp. E70]
MKKETEQEVDIQIRRYEKRSGVFNWLYFDRKEASLKQIKSGDNLRFGDKLGSLNYDIHTGSIGGLETKIIAFIASLFVLPSNHRIYYLAEQKQEGEEKEGLST